MDFTIDELIKKADLAIDMGHLKTASVWLMRAIERDQNGESHAREIDRLCWDLHTARTILGK
jgi:hypothetical protein